MDVQSSRNSFYRHVGSSVFRNKINLASVWLQVIDPNPVRLCAIQVPQMRIACIPPCLSRLPISCANAFRSTPAVEDPRGAIGIENVARFVRREFPHAAAWDIEAVAHARPLVHPEP